MARIRRTKLSWKPSGSELVVSYRLYWSKGQAVSYDANFFELGNVNEVYLPDVLKHIPKYGVSIFLGISAVDQYGNESDITPLNAPYRPIVPAAPKQLLLTDQDAFYFESRNSQNTGHQDEWVDQAHQKEEWDELARMSKPLIDS